jgi:Domain of unknown function (DUF4926)
MAFRLYEEAALARDLPEYRLRRGDLLRLVERHVSIDGTKGYSAEVLGATGKTLAVVAVSEASLVAVRDNDVLKVRPAL